MSNDMTKLRWSEHLGKLISPPLRQWEQWYLGARKANIFLAEAMCLSTASASAVPSSRMVLMRGYAERGLVFFSDNRSRKGQEMTENKAVCALFHWPLLERQVRISGHISPLDTKLSDAYFASRPNGSKASALVSTQSAPLDDYTSLQVAQQRLLAGPTEQLQQRPDYWQGWWIEPNQLEFWQGCPDRLHKRTLWQKKGDGWQSTMLAP